MYKLTDSDHRRIETKSQSKIPLEKELFCTIPRNIRYLFDDP